MPLRKVWFVLTTIGNRDKWQSAITKPGLKGTLSEGAKFVWKTGGVKINSTLHTVTPYEAFGWTGKTFGMYAIHNRSLSDQKGATLVTVDESMEGFLTVLFKKSFNRNLETLAGSIEN
jgi:hypothetical protein